MLVDEDLDIIRLFTPPFENTDKQPGYIKSYPPGVRENGGQYTHAAAWLVIALAKKGEGDAAYRLFKMLNPINHALNPEATERYRVEPYVVAADIYSADDKAGRGGWTWYTGSAGWLHQAAVEAILGIRKEADRLFVEPTIPGAWNGFSATLRLANSEYRIRVKKEAGLRANRIEIDGVQCKTNWIVLRQEGRHDVVVKLPTPR